MERSNRKKKWYKVLDDIVYNYNHSYHRTIKATPYDVWRGKDTNKQSIKFVDYDFKVGDKVRIKLVKKVFTKGDAVKFIQQQTNVPVTGTFDAATDKAVKALQKKHGLLVDGIVGPKTWAFLD